MKNLLRWLSLIFAWVFREGLLVWLTVFVPLVAFVAIILWDNEFSCRIAGLVLQLGGLGTVALGIRNTRRLFGRPGMRERVKGWLRRRPRFHPEINMASMTGTGSSSGEAEAGLWAEVASDAYIEVRLAALEKNLREVREGLNAFKQKVRKDFGKVTNDIAQEAHVRSEYDQSLRTKLEETGAGGLDISAMGIVWLAIGTILTTFPAELSGVIQEMWRLLLVTQI